MAQLTLIAHAETAATRHAAFPADEGLSPAGLAAAQSFAKPSRKAPRREARHHDAVLRSPARAAIETAAAMGLRALAEPALRDLDAGRWAGKDFASIAAVEPEAAATFFADPGYAGHGGEAVEALLRRVAAWLDRSRGRRGRILAVTHAAVVRAAVAAALDAPATAFFRIDAPPLTGVTLSDDGRRWSLRAGAMPGMSDRLG